MREPRRVRVFKHNGYWHFWCPCCTGGDWFVLASVARRRAARHVAAQH